MTTQALLDKIKSHIPEAAEFPLKNEKWKRDSDPQIQVPPARLSETVEQLNTLGYDFLVFLTAVDWMKDNKLEVVYHFLKMDQPSEKCFIKVELPRDGEPSLPSITSLYAGADWQERETYDLLGIRFNNHPNLKRILLWEGYEGWPLRKDYVHTQDKYDNGQEIGIPKAPPTPPAPKPPAPPQEGGTAK